MSIAKRLELTGAAGSPYTRKMLGVLRYRHLPFSVYWGASRIPKGYPTPKVRLLPTFFFPDGDAGALVPATDSTPIIRRLEAEYDGRSVIPDNPVLSFLNELIEDYADEWLTKAMFHFRWAHEADWKNAAPMLVYWNTSTADADQAKAIAAEFAKRQIDRLYVVGSNAITAQTIEHSYSRFVEILDKLIQRSGFVLGARPSAADFALFGQLTQLAIVEPTSAAITTKISHRVRAWVDLMEDLSGLDPKPEDWITLDDARDTLGDFLAEIGRTYAPAMIANAKAILAGADRFDAEIDGRAWTQPVFKYQAKCLAALRERHAALSDTEKETVNSLLAGTGCDMLFE